LYKKNEKKTCQKVGVVGKFTAKNPQLWVKTQFTPSQMKKFMAPLLGLLVAVGVMTFGVDPAFAQLIDPTDSPSNIQGATGSEGSFRTILRTIINFVLYFLGLVATIMVIYGGFLYITSQGEDTEKAKKVLMYAAIGIVIILISFALVNTLLTAADGVSTGF
jgi:hypothetical protein